MTLKIPIYEFEVHRNFNDDKRFHVYTYDTDMLLKLEIVEKNEDYLSFEEP